MLLVISCLTRWIDLWLKFSCVIVQLKAVGHYFAVVLFGGCPEQKGGGPFVFEPLEGVGHLVQHCDIHYKTKMFRLGLKRYLV